MKQQSNTSKYVNLSTSIKIPCPLKFAWMPLEKFTARQKHSEGIVLKKQILLKVQYCNTRKSKLSFCSLVLQFSNKYSRYILQVAGCRLKFNYNWKTAGT